MRRWLGVLITLDRASAFYSRRHVQVLACSRTSSIVPVLFVARPKVCGYSSARRVKSRLAPLDVSRVIVPCRPGESEPAGQSRLDYLIPPCRSVSWNPFPCPCPRSLWPSLGSLLC